MHGQHLLRCWTGTQATVALSSGEAELAGAVRATAEAIGMKNVIQELGGELREKSIIYTDASAALGILNRKGAGGIRHLDTRLLWVQDQESRGKAAYGKISGKENPADLGTKFLDESSIQGHMCRYGVQWEGGRPAIASGTTDWGPQPACPP